MLVQMGFSGSVSALDDYYNTLDDPLANYFSVGDSLSGYFVYDTASLFTSRSGADNSRYDNAISKFSFSIGGSYNATSSQADLQMLDGSGGQDVITIDAYRSEGLLAPDIGSNFVFAITLDFRDGLGTSFDSTHLFQPDLDFFSFTDQGHGVRVYGASTSGRPACRIGLNIDLPLTLCT